MMPTLDVLRYVLLMQWPYASEVCSTALVVISCVNTRLADRAKEWDVLLGVGLTLMTAFGGGIIAPLLVGKLPVIFTNDLFLPLVVVVYMFTARFERHFVPFARMTGVWQILVLLSVIGRVNMVVAFVNMAFSLYPPSKFYPIALFGPIMTGALSGIGGLFLPLDKGLTSLSSGVPWNVQMCFACSSFYHVAINDPFLLGGMFRGTLGLEELTAVDAQFCAVAFATAVTAIHVFTGYKEFNPFWVSHKILYAVTGIPGQTATIAKGGQDCAEASSSAEEKNGGDEHNRPLYDLSRRKKLQKCFSVVKVVAAVLVLLLAAANQQPPSYLLPGETLEPGHRLASCSFLSFLRSDCEPHGAVLTENGSLVVYRGAQPPSSDGVGGGASEILWSSPSIPSKKLKGDDLHLEVKEDGHISIVCGGKTLWSTPLSSSGSNAPNYRVEARLDAADGALSVHKAGGVVWSSKTAKK